jgi:hypothetical protein
LTSFETYEIISHTYTVPPLTCFALTGLIRVAGGMPIVLAEGWSPPPPV